MSSRDFNTLLRAQWAKKKFLCVGLDPVIEKFPQTFQDLDKKEALFNFCCRIVDATAGSASCYKPNIAFFEAHGDEGVAALRDIVLYIHEKIPEMPLICDAKRADIGNTNEGYVRGIFEHLMMDAITIHPYLGQDAVQPFLDRKEKGIFVLCRTSNKGAGEFQDMKVDDVPLYQKIAEHVANSWNTNLNCGLVVGATYADELALVREIAPHLPILIPGIGAQGGDLEDAVKNGKDEQGEGFIINAGRSIMYASSGTDFEDAAQKSAQALDSAITQALLN